MNFRGGEGIVLDLNGGGRVMKALYQGVPKEGRWWGLKIYYGEKEKDNAAGKQFRYSKVEAGT